ncbi:MAG: hypothetical protein M3R00_03160, partial [Pseudomonadota bacterium]|nr:hypothetical protein [Pseudomonadota bacterium]
MQESQNKDMYLISRLIGDFSSATYTIFEMLTLDNWGLDAFRRAIGIDVIVHPFQFQNFNVKLQINRASGDSHGKLSIYRDAKIIFCVFNLADSTSFANAGEVLQDIKRNAEPGSLVILVGNETMLARPRVVDAELAQALADRYNASYIEVKNNSHESMLELFEGGAIRYLSQLSNAPSQREQNARLTFEQEVDALLPLCCIPYQNVQEYVDCLKLLNALINQARHTGKNLSQCYLMKLMLVEKVVDKFYEGDEKLFLPMFFVEYLDALGWILRNVAKHNLTLDSGHYQRLNAILIKIDGDRILQNELITKFGQFYAKGATVSYPLDDVFQSLVSRKMAEWINHLPQDQQFRALRYVPYLGPIQPIIDNFIVMNNSNVCSVGIDLSGYCSVQEKILQRNSQAYSRLHLVYLRAVGQVSIKNESFLFLFEGIKEMLGPSDVALLNRYMA